MARLGVWLALGAALFGGGSASAQRWADIKGQVVWKGTVPEQKVAIPAIHAKLCAMKKERLEENYIINPKNKGLKDVFVWIRPLDAKGDDAFPAKEIHPDLAKPDKPAVEIDQPCCRFEPHVLAARAGQTLVIKNSAPAAHNANFSSEKCGTFNPLIQAGGKFELPKPLVFEPGEIQLGCNIHGWMKASIRTFDHPYFAVTDEDGTFEIKKAPVGKYALYVFHSATGWLGGKKGNRGRPIVINAGGTNVGQLDMSEGR